MEIKKGQDIAQTIGGIDSMEAAQQLFERTLDGDQLARIRRIQHPRVLIKIANAIAMCGPRSVFIHTGTANDRQYIRDLCLQNGEEASLAMDNHTIHFDLKDEQGRIIDRTYYIVDPDEAVSSLAKKMLRPQAIVEVRQKMSAIMQGKTMLVGFFMRGPVGALGSNPALEITSSAYVMHSADILYRHAFDAFDAEVERLGHFFANIHSQGPNRPQDLPNARVFMDRRDRTTYSMYCTYAGNTLLLKKGNHRFAVDKAVYEGNGRELAEHMFITGIENPGGGVTWFTGAAPSGCGKTTTAMAGNRFVGDDLAQMWIADDGSIRSINPENGIFGIVQDVNSEGDPKLMENLRKPGTEVIWSNVLVDAAGIPHWTGNGEPPPVKGNNFQGPWEQGMLDAEGRPVPISHPNARVTLASRALSNYSDEAENPAGVLTRVITYSGRDADTMPPVWATWDTDQGVVIGACIVSAATAAEVGATGVKRAPWANAPFIPGSLGDYMAAQFQFFGNPRITPENKPLMAGLNYFLTHAARGGSSNKLLGEKRDVKVWLGWLARCAHRKVSTIKTPVGLLPCYDDLATLFSDIIHKPYPHELYNKQFSLYIDHIVGRIELQLAAYGKESGIPDRLFDILGAQRENLTALRQAHGPVVAPDLLAQRQN